jgi:uncharacterized protein YfaS (alpha-2-macroglobulin family)
MMRATATWLLVLLASSAPVREEEHVEQPEAKGLSFALAGGEERAAATRLARPPAQRLPEAEAEALLRRLPALAAAPGAGFALRESSLPPPRTGATVRDPFPPPAVAEVPNVEASPLTVLRRAPEGEVPLAPSLQVTFSRPMVSITSHDELAQGPLPVRLTPEPPGRWRWAGARTLLFEPEGRFPMATSYRAEVPAGATAADGERLAKAEAWTFTTPAPKLVASFPTSGPVRRDTALVAAFDQRIDAKAVLAAIAVKGASQLALVDAKDLDAEARAVLDRAGEGRALAFRAVEPLPADSPIEVTVAAGAPSAEGPRRTEKPQSWTFRTYGPLRVVEHRCGWNGECPPGAPWQVQLSNPLDEKAFDRKALRIDPPLAPNVTASGPWLTLQGMAKGRTTYRVTLPASLRDAFGQTLGRDETLSFAVGPAPRRLSAQGGPLVVLDPAAGGRFPVWSVNHEALRVRLSAVGPEHWEAFQEQQRNAWREESLGPPPGRIVSDTTLQVGGAPDEWKETRIDLRPALADGLGHLVLSVEPTRQDKRNRERVWLWIQCTRIGLAAFADSTSLLAWATALGDGRPLSGAEASVLGGKPAATAADGTAMLPLPPGGARMLLVRSGRDVAFLPRDTWGGGGPGWERREPGSRLAFLVFDDRHLYRPGETVSLKGIVRRIGAGPQGDVDKAGDALRSLDWSLADSRGNEVAKGQLAPSRVGSFDLELKLPPTMNLGNARLDLRSPAGGWQHTFDVQEFRRPEFEVSATAGAGPHVVGTQASVEVAAAYYAGGGLPDADVAWEVTASPASYAPPGWDGFSFATWTPWWESFRRPGGPERTERFQGRTDRAGKHRLRIDLQRVDPPRPTALRAQATVQDVNRQAWTASASLLVHPASLYVGLRAERAFVRAGVPLPVELIVTDIDGKAVAGTAIAVRAERRANPWGGGEIAENQECEVISAPKPVRCAFTAKEGGVWKITARVKDGDGRRSESDLTAWVAGAKAVASRQLQAESAQVIPDRREYAAGETAELLVISPISPADGVLTLRREGLVRSQAFHVENGSATLRVPIEAGFVPNVHASVDLVGSAERSNDAGEPDPRLPRRPAFASGAIDLSVPPRQRTLALEVVPRERSLDPGGETVLEVGARDAAGQPVGGAEVTLAVVDEAVLALSGYRWPDPLDAFYPRRGDGVEARHSRELVQLAAPDLALGDTTLGFAAGMAAESAPPPPPAPAPQMLRKMAGAPGGAPEPELIKARVDLRPLALFAAAVETGPDGRARVPVKLPDSLTRYRVMAIVAQGQRFGRGDSAIVARLPLMVRPSPPRFLNFGDRLELPVVVQNQTDRELSVDVALRASNLEVLEGAGRRITVPAQDRVEVRFPAAARLAGQARLQVAAASGPLADAAEATLPVWTPATTEAFATYGQIDRGAIAQPVKAPSGVVREFGGLEVTTSSTALQALTDAVLYLNAYPFECSEQLASRVLAVAALRDVLAAFQAEGLPAREELVAATKRDIERLRGLQNDDGGFGFWRRGDESWPWLGVHVALALERARAKGFEVPGPMLERSKGYLRDIEGRIPSWYGVEARRTLIAFALNVRARLGDPDPGRARKLLREAGVEGLGLEGLGFLLPLLKDAPEAAQIRRHLANRAVEEAGTAHFAVSYGDAGALLLHSDRRADAIVLEALVADQPANPLIPKLAAGLLAHRVAGHWASTQENAFVLLALDRYFQAYEKATPDFLARAWLGPRFAGEHAFRGHTTERHHVEVPMAELAATPEDLVLSKDGPGRLYYRIGLRYAPASLMLEAADHGFAVERRYEAVDARDDVRRDADLTWHVKAGARVRVSLSMLARSRRYHVALVDPLPAGLEALNPALATTGTVPTGPADQVTVVGAPGWGGPGRPGGSWWWWTRTWYEHQNLRDERVEAFSSLLWEGEWSYAYVARATTPGRFVVPPPKAEEMYHPETFGRGPSDVVVVE